MTTTSTGRTRWRPILRLPRRTRPGRSDAVDVPDALADLQSYPEPIEVDQLELRQAFAGHRPASPEVAALRYLPSGPFGLEQHAAGDDQGTVLAEFTITSEPGNERKAIDGLRRALTGVAGATLPQDRIASLETAVAEATMNAIEHGNQNIAELLVEVRIWLEPRAVVVRVADQGRGTPMSLDVPEPDIEAKLRGDQSPRGWGLFLIRNMVDDVRMRADEERHIVELVTRLTGDEQ